MISRRRFISNSALSVAASSMPKLSTPLLAETPLSAGKKLEALDYRGVKLQPGMLKSQYDQTRSFYLGLSNDDILRGYRLNAGLPAPGADMGGWAEHDTSTTFGQWLSGMARMYRATGDQEMLNKASYLLAEWDKTFQAKGSPYYAYANKPEQSHYPFDKTMGGLVDMYVYGGDKAALRPMEELQIWGAKNLSRMRGPATAEVMSGPVAGGIEWYTLSENLYRAYQATGDARFRDFGDLWRYDNFWLQFLQKGNINVSGLHAYSHVNTLSGAAMTYAVTGDPKYLAALRAAYDYLDDKQLFATGGYGPGEQLVADDGTLGRSLEMEGNTFETPCGSWAGFKMARYLMEFTGEARYGDWIERLIYNGIGSALPMADRSNPFFNDIWSHAGLNGGYHVAERGKTFYYADYRVGSGRKDYFPEGWPCCSGTFIQDVADYHNLIYLRGRRSLHVNLYIPSEVTWTENSATVSLLQETGYPESKRSTLTITASKRVSFALNLRNPGWSEGMSLSLNGSPLNVPAQPGSWVTVDRQWQSGDKLTVQIDCSLRQVPIDRQNPNRVALVYGPVVLVEEQKTALAKGAQLKQDGSAQTALRFRGASRTESTFVPFYSVPFGVSYAMYMDL